MLGLGDAGQRKCSLACKNQVEEGLECGLWVGGFAYAKVSSGVSC